MNVQLVYATMTSHSRKIAETIAKATGLTAHNLKDCPELPPCDLLILVGGIYGGESRQELLDFAGLLTPERAARVALVTSSATGRPQGSLKQILRDAGIPLAGEYLCRGNFLLFGLGHPSRGEKDGAAAFVQALLR